jgi:hypothetical protein
MVSKLRLMHGKIAAFLMGLHPRLGQDSSLWMLSDVSTVIVEMMLGLSFTSL